MIRTIVKNPFLRRNAWKILILAVTGICGMMKRRHDQRKLARIRRMQAAHS